MHKSAGNAIWFDDAAEKILTVKDAISFIEENSGS